MVKEFTEEPHLFECSLYLGLFELIFKTRTNRHATCVDDDEGDDDNEDDDEAFF